MTSVLNRGTIDVSIKAIHLTTHLSYIYLLYEQEISTNQRNPYREAVPATERLRRSRGNHDVRGSQRLHKETSNEEEVKHRVISIADIF